MKGDQKEYFNTEFFTSPGFDCQVPRPTRGILRPLLRTMDDDEPDMVVAVVKRCCDRYLFSNLHFNNIQYASFISAYRRWKVCLCTFFTVLIDLLVTIGIVYLGLLWSAR